MYLRSFYNLIKKNLYTHIPTCINRNPINFLFYFFILKELEMEYSFFTKLTFTYKPVTFSDDTLLKTFFQKLDPQIQHS